MKLFFKRGAKLVKTGTKILSIHLHGNKSGRRIWAFFVGFWAIAKIISEIYIRVEINRAGVFGPFLLDFGAISKIISETYVCVEINRAGVFGPFLLDFWAISRIMSQIQI